MRKFLSVLSLLMALTTAIKAYAADTWLGGVVINNSQRGNTWQTPYNDQTVIQLNIADYNEITILFDYYKKGVTESGNSVWDKIDAQAQMVNDNSGAVIKQNFIANVGSDGNNAVYKFRLRNFAPDTVIEIPQELKNRGTLNAHLNILMDGSKKLSIPVQFTYIP